MKIILCFIMNICLCSFLFGEQIIFKKNNDSFVISYDKSDFSYLYEQSSPLEIDSIKNINEKIDSLYVFFYNSNTIFYCKKFKDKYNLFFVQNDEYEKCYHFFNYDVNNDNAKEIITFYTLEGKGVLSIYRFNKNLLTLQKLLQHEFFLFIHMENILQDVKFKNNKLYFIYSPPSTENESFLLKIGVIDYTKDISKEIYIKPLSLLTEDEWNRF